MDRPNAVVGVGCFAGEETLSRVLRRMIASYSLGEPAHALRQRAEGAGASRVLGDLMAGAGGGDSFEKERVAGFFLSFKDRTLNLSLFTRRGGLKCEKFTTSLDMG
ncbi:MAG: hypothetical protein MUD16_17615 [Desulfobacterales bacterium]|jgi:hypothetical protein|nr:hypothetical protein [Desulfobacterales bacterium]